VSPNEWLRLADGLPRQSSPGSKYAYSNTNYVVLGLLLERLTGRPLGRLLDDRLVRPLRLTATSYQPDPTSWPGERADVAHGYLPGDFVEGSGDLPIDDSGGVNGGAGAADGVVSTAADLTRFYAALLSGRLLDRRLIGQMTTVVPQPRSYLGLPVEEDGYGLGLARYRLRCGIVWGHGGNLGQYYGIVLAARDGHRIVAVLVNGATGKRSDTLFAVITAMLRAAELAYCRRS
jgi:D-alanyl-D-alanine carboxypeptidase